MTKTAHMKKGIIEPHPITIAKPSVVLSIDEYEDLLEDACIGTSAKLRKDIDSARKEFKKGKVYDWRIVRRELGLGS